MDPRRRRKPGEPHDGKHSRRKHRTPYEVPYTTLKALELEKSGLTPDQRVSLFGPGDDEMHIHASLTAASSGVAVLACQHIARRLLIDPDAKRLTRRDLLAIRMAPQIAAEVKRRSTKPDPPTQPSGAHDPITALLEGTTEEETVRAENKR